MRKSRQVLLSLLLLIGIHGTAQAGMSHEEHAIKARKSAFSLLSWYLGPMVRMTKGITPFDQQQFAQNAEVLAFLSKLPKTAFIPGSDQGKTKARAEIWSQPEAFRKANALMETEAAKLAELAKSGDQEALKAQLEKVRHACKSCHEDFKKK